MGVFDNLITYEAKYEPIHVQKYNYLGTVIQNEHDRSCELVDTETGEVGYVQLHHSVKANAGETCKAVEVTTYRQMQKIQVNGIWKWVSNPEGMQYNRVTKLIN